MLGLDPPGSASLEIPERRILRSLPAQFENREYWGTGRRYRRPRPDAHQLAIAEKPYSHTLSTARRGKTQLIEHKVIVYFLRTAQLRLGQSHHRNAVKEQDKARQEEGSQEAGIAAARTWIESQGPGGTTGGSRFADRGRAAQVAAGRSQAPRRTGLSRVHRSGAEGHRGAPPANCGGTTGDSRHRYQYGGEVRRDTLPPAAPRLSLNRYGCTGLLISNACWRGTPHDERLGLTVASLTDGADHESRLSREQRCDSRHALPSTSVRQLADPSNRTKSATPFGD